MSSAFTAITIPDLNAGPQPDTGGGNARGYAAGYSEGIRQAEAELSERRAILEAEFGAATAHAAARADRGAAAVDTAIAALNARATPVLTEAHDTLATSCFDLAEAILGVELATGDTSARAAVTRALGNVNAAAVTGLRMNPDDLSVISDTILANPNIVFSADPTLGRGDAIADLSHGWLDARIATAAARARAELLGQSGAPAT